MDEGIDWTAFAQQATEAGLISLAAYSLIRFAPDQTPDDILSALRTIVDGTRERNRALLDKLARSIESAPFDGSPLAIESVHAAATRALTNNPNDHAPWRDLGQTFSKLKRHDRAIVCYDRAIALVPNDPGNWRDRGIMTFIMGNPEQALAYIDKALALNSKDSIAWVFRSHALSGLERVAEAVEASDRALALDPENTAAERASIHALLFSCDWRRREEIKQRIKDGLSARRGVVTPFNHLAISDSEASNLDLARLWATGVPQAAEPLWRGERYRHDRIRIAYISTDFLDTLSVNAIARRLRGA